jgi:hypothetical protein
VTPSFLSGEAGADLRLNTIAAAYGEIKHNYALVEGQAYAEVGCEIPDGYVEPAPAAYDALIDYAARGEKFAALVDPQDASLAGKHFKRVGAVLRVLRAIVGDELAGRPLSAAERRWLGMVAELDLNRKIILTGSPPTYTGWYFDLFFARQSDGMRGADFIADFFTSQEGVAYAGATAPRLGIFVVDAGGPPRAFVGPVARAYETFGPLAQRYTDEAARKLEHRDEPWAASYTIPAPAAPSQLGLEYDDVRRQVVVTSDRALGVATIKALDHHRVPIATLRANVKKGETRVALSAKGLGGLSIEIGEFWDFAVLDAYGRIGAEWGKTAEQ